MSPSDNSGFRKEPILPPVTAPDDLARTLADTMREHQRAHDISNSPYGHVCGYDCIARTLASVVSRRDADLRTRIETMTGELARLVDEAPFMSWEGKHGATVLRAVPAGQLRLTLARGLDGDPHEVAP